MLTLEQINQFRTLQLQLQTMLPKFRKIRATQFDLYESKIHSSNDQRLTIHLANHRTILTNFAIKHELTVPELNQGIDFFCTDPLPTQFQYSTLRIRLCVSLRKLLEIEKKLIIYSDPLIPENKLTIIILEELNSLEKEVKTIEHDQLKLLHPALAPIFIEDIIEPLLGIQNVEVQIEQHSFRDHYDDETTQEDNSETRPVSFKTIQPFFNTRQISSITDFITLLDRHFPTLMKQNTKAADAVQKMKLMITHLTKSTKQITRLSIHNQNRRSNIHENFDVGLFAKILEAQRRTLTYTNSAIDINRWLHEVCHFHIRCIPDADNLSTVEQQIQMPNISSTFIKRAFKAFSQMSHSEDYFNICYYFADYFYMQYFINSSNNDYKILALQFYLRCITTTFQDLKLQFIDPLLQNVNTLITQDHLYYNVFDEQQTLSTIRKLLSKEICQSFIIEEFQAFNQDLIATELEATTRAAVEIAKVYKENTEKNLETCRIFSSSSAPKPENTTTSTSACSFN